VGRWALSVGRGVWGVGRTAPTTADGHRSALGMGVRLADVVDGRLAISSIERGYP
jgi:hypothetical protein